MIQFVQMIEKLINDINEPIRQLAKRAFCLFVIAHLAEGYDAAQRAQGHEAEQQIIAANQQMFSLMYDVVNQHQKRNEMVQMI